jgi:hypothetical protein
VFEGIRSSRFYLSDNKPAIVNTSFEEHQLSKRYQSGVEHNKLSTKKGSMKTIAIFSLLVVVAIFDQAKLQAITGLQIMNW